MSVVGRTVARIEEGEDFSGTVLIHFTDGTALRVVGHSYEDVSLDWAVLEPVEVRRLAATAQGRRETQRLARLNREAWDALPPEEKAAREAARRAKTSPTLRAVDDVLRNLARGWAADINRQAYGTELVIPIPAKKPRARRS